MYNINFLFRLSQIKTQRRNEDDPKPDPDLDLDLDHDHDREVVQETVVVTKVVVVAMDVGDITANKPRFSTMKNSE